MAGGLYDKDVHGLSDSPERTGGICRVTLLRSADREVGCEESFGIVPTPQVNNLVYL